MYFKMVFILKIVFYYYETSYSDLYNGNILLKLPFSSKWLL